MLKGWAVNDPKYRLANVTIIQSCKEDDSCFLFNMLGPQGANIGDTGAGVILLIISLVMLCSCLMGMVKLLNSLLGEKVKEAIRTGVNKDIPVHGLGWLTGYLAMLVGAVLTVLVKSSSVFTSTLTPLAPFSYLTLFCPIVNEISGPKGVTHHIFYLVQKIAVVQRKKES